MDEPSTSSDEDQPKPSLIYDGTKWFAPPPTSGETDSGTQGFSVRYVQPSENLINMDKNLKHYITLYSYQPLNPPTTLY